MPEIKLRPETVKAVDGSGNTAKAKVFVCEKCGCDAWHIFKIEGKSDHCLQCANRKCQFVCVYGFAK